MIEMIAYIKASNQKSCFFFFVLIVEINLRECPKKTKYVEKQGIFWVFVADFGGKRGDQAVRRLCFNSLNKTEKLTFPKTGFA